MKIFFGKKAMPPKDEKKKYNNNVQMVNNDRNYNFLSFNKKNEIIDNKVQNIKKKINK
jgi:hypothetical protein